MNIHAIYHVAYEGLGFIGDWIQESNLRLSQTFAYQDPQYPDPDGFDGLIILGGGMSVGDEQDYPWLKTEKEFILEAIDRGKKVLGICLGAQLIANSLGAKIYKSNTPEIGWFPVRKSFLFHSWFTAFDDKEAETVFQWHSDTFDLPKGAVRLFRSTACENQAFQIDDHVLALQFHLEMNRENIQELIKHSGDDLMPKQFVQNAEKILKLCETYSESGKEMLNDLLSCFFLEE